MSSSNFAPDFNFNQPDPSGPPEGPQELFRFNPYNQTGVPTWYNWLGVNKVGSDNEYSESSPGRVVPLFHRIPDELLKTPRPQIAGGMNKATYAQKCPSQGYHPSEQSIKVDPTKLYCSGQYSAAINGLFGNTSVNNVPQNWGIAWNGYYSSFKWYQMYNCYLINDTDEVYPFATKGVSLRMKVPEAGKSSAKLYTNIRPYTGGEDWGDHQMINNGWGLWRDLDGFYYIFEMLPYGDNAVKQWSTKGTSGRNHRNMYTDEGSPGHDLYPDHNIFPQWDDTYIGTSDWLQELRPVLGCGEERGLQLYSTESIIEDLFFVGFSLQLHHDKKAGAAKSHTIMFSRVTPIPFHAPRDEKKTTCVLGEPTSLEDLKKGLKKIHFWDSTDPTTGERGVDTLADYVTPPHVPKEDELEGYPPPEDTTPAAEGVDAAIATNDFTLSYAGDDDTIPGGADFTSSYAGDDDTIPTGADYTSSYTDNY